MVDINLSITMNRLQTNLVTILSSLFIFISISGIFAQKSDRIEKDLNNIIYYDANIDFQKVPGLVIGLIHGDSTYTYTFGSLSKSEKIVPSQNSIFEIGGITKVFTASLVEILVDEGLMDYETNLNEYLPTPIRNDKSNMSLYEAITHTAGMPRLPHGIGKREREANNPYAYYAKSDLHDFYKNYYPVIDEESRYQYSHVSYALIETAIENVVQQKYEDVLREKLLEPLQLNDTNIDLTAQQETRLSPGYNILGNPTKPWRFSSFKGSVGMKSSLADLLKFVQVQMGDRNPAYASLFDDMHNPLYETEVAKGNYIGKSWHVIKKKNHNVVLHAGSTSGHQAFVGFVKETNTGVVILSNSENSTNSLGYLLLRYLNNNWKKVKAKS
jgi:CubicO group peptidase (beta-lactamase class C family)